MQTFSLYPATVRRRLTAWSQQVGCSFALLLAACGGASSGGSHDLGSTADENAEPALPIASGVWIGVAANPQTRFGSAERYYFPSRRTRFLIDFDSGPEPFIVFGGVVSAALQPLDFDVGFPLDLEYGNGSIFNSEVLPPLEGFPYRLQVEPDESNGQLLLTRFALNDAFSDWCAGQTPMLGPGLGGLYECLGTDGYGWSDDGCSYTPHGAPLDAGGSQQSQPIDCGKLYLCARRPHPTCVCTESECSVGTGSEPQLLLRRSGEELVGVFSGAVFLSEFSSALIGLGDVRFHRWSSDDEVDERLQP